MRLKDCATDYSFICDFIILMFNRYRKQVQSRVVGKLICVSFDFAFMVVGQRITVLFSVFLSLTINCSMKILAVLGLFV